MDGFARTSGPARNARRGRDVEHLTKELRYAARSLMREPGLAAIAIVALALGIGLTTIMFSIVYGALHRGLPFEGADRLVHLSRANLPADIERMGVPIHDFVDWRERQRSFEELGAFYMGTVNLRWGERPERFEGAFLSANALEILSVAPVLGRDFGEEDTRPGAPLTVLLGYELWQDAFEGDRSVLGRSLTVNGETAQVIGVMPQGFHFPIQEEVWVPIRLDPVALPRGEGSTLDVFGKLEKGAGIDGAVAEFSDIAAQLAAEHPETNEGVTPVIRPFTEIFISEQERSLLYAMLVTVLLVLLIACANVTNLLLVRASGRTRDVAIQTAMGASRSRVMARMLAESTVLAVLGAVAGTGVAWIGIRAFRRAIATVEIPFWMAFELDAPILLFVAGVTVLAAALAGVLPAIRATSANVSGILKDESRGSSSLRIGRLSRGLVVAEIAMSLALLVGSGLMIRSVLVLQNQDHPYPTEQVFTARIGIFEERFPDPAARLRFWRAIEERVAAIPGVRDATLMTALPAVGSSGGNVQIEGTSYAADRELPFARWALATPGFTEALEIRVLRGRAFSELDGADAPPVAIVNESFERTHFPGESAVGRRIRRGDLDTDDPWREVVGVVPDLDMEGFPNEEEAPDGFYIPLAQSDARFLSLAARTDGSPLSLTPEVRRAVLEVDTDTPIYWVGSLQDRIDEQNWFFGVFGTLFAVFGAAALFMASVGLYGVMSFSVGQRVQEVGIRMALGAEGGRVLRMILTQGLGQIGLGVVLGLGLSVFVVNGLQLLVVDANHWDPRTYGVVLSVLVATGVAAILVPALRATRIDPMEALRYE